MRKIADTLTHKIVRLMGQSTARWSQDRGDVPGWVLVAVMTAGLVTALWMIADTQLTAVLTKAITSVTK